QFGFVEATTHSFPNYRDLRDRNVTLSGLIAYRASPVGLGIGDAASRGWAYLATGNYFDVLGVTPAGFHGAENIYWPDVWVPMAMEAQIEEHDWLENRNTSNCLVAGRL